MGIAALPPGEAGTERMTDDLVLGAPLETFGNAGPGVLTVNAYDAHPNERAHALAADAIAAFVTEHVAQ